MEIAVEFALDEAVWDALTDDLRDFWRDCEGDPTLSDMSLGDRIDLFLQIKTSQWLGSLPPELASSDLDDGVPF